MLEDVASKSPESYFLSHLAQQGTKFENACEGELLRVLRMEDVRNDCPFLPTGRAAWYALRRGKSVLIYYPPCRRQTPSP